MGCAASVEQLRQELGELDISSAENGGDLGSFEASNGISWRAKLKEFTYKELQQATGGFRKKNLIGQGGFGEVYRGEMMIEVPACPSGGADPLRNEGESSGMECSDRETCLGGLEGEPRARGLEGAESREEGERTMGQEGRAGRGGEETGQGGAKVLQKTKVAIKRLMKPNKEGYEEFVKEVLVLGQLQHPNLVKLYGYSSERGAMLVYELVEGGSLADALEDSSLGSLLFSWEDRLKVVSEVARGLAYLHHHKFIHRDIKPHNILLTPEYGAKLSDFGMVRPGPKGKLLSIVSTRIMGTQDYIDPKYMETGHLHYSSDVYSLGVCLLEMVTGRRAKDEGGTQFVERLQKRLATEEQKKLTCDDYVDPALRGVYDDGQVRQLAVLATLCTKHMRRHRPSVQEIQDAIKLIMGSLEPS